MPVPIYTVDEIVSLLKHSTLLTLLVEGTSDAVVYRKIEELLLSYSLNIIPAGGRGKLFQVFIRRSEYLAANVIFLADKDFFLFSGIPENYSDIVWTEGYSIENDLISGSKIIDFFSVDERESFNKYIEIIAEWFSFIIYKYIHNDERLKCDLAMQQIYDFEKQCLHTSYCEEIGYTEPKNDYLEILKQDPMLKIRGKNVLNVLTTILSSNKRASKFSKLNIMEICTHDENTIFKIKTLEKIKAMIET